ncbi:hypothetical protein BZA05DRAFT_397272 [Tricharina praecox]|uniref:uncharacterized protein n=1 Tax=Tricharina praecox TaxID=43433 RepID=UPI002220CBA2|nr:uncharacterized protein BZA05DRAFT_397272 [Tricharina praecox]KAI5852237.1 hypothetical protein BZA05DRAFT_397272 [Tricharina praecox]
MLFVFTFLWIFFPVCFFSCIFFLHLFPASFSCIFFLHLFRASGYSSCMRRGFFFMMAFGRNNGLLCTSCLHFSFPGY